MIAQFILSILLAGILLYAWTEYRRSPAVALVTLLIASAGLYFVWMPDHSTRLAELVGVGRGVDLILYIWVCISLIVMLNLHLKLRTQMELITTLARKVALADTSHPAEIADSIAPAESDAASHPAAAESQAAGLQLSERRA
jgi:small membrane protein